MSPQRKRGRLSTHDERYIRANAGAMTPEEIGVELHRTTETIQKFITKYSLRPPVDEYEDEHRQILKDALHQKPFWKEIVKQLTESELCYFEATWVGIIRQFREDVEDTEELQVKHLIILEILVDRSMKERKAHQQNIEDTQLQLDTGYAQDPLDRDNAHLSSMETQLAHAKSAIVSYTTEHTKLLGEIKYIQKSLKATREERVKQIETSKSTLKGLLRMLENPEYREEMGRSIELMRIAKKKEYQRLSEFYMYSDDKLDRPLLTPETTQEGD